ncbi:MAG TPA: hypothetical protein VHJ38_11510 [Nitrososphaeraceae archaeon]|jgi:hypothetical protein|nr:hypothetical protein [Nitrososphaeraceae archaeon]
MGRRRKIDRLPITTIKVYTENLDTISKLKNKRESQYDFIRRVLLDWQDFQDYKLDMDQVLKLKDRQILMLENELKDKLLKEQKVSC